MRGKFVRRFGLTAGTAGVVLVSAACGGAAGSNNEAGSGSTGSAASDAGKLLKGSQLKGMLLPATAMPKGFKLNPEITRDTGDAIAESSAAPMPPGKVCSALSGTAWIRVSEISPASFAQSDYTDAGKTQEIALEVDAFHGDEATKVMAALKKVFTKCKTFTEKSDDTTVKIKLVSAKLVMTSGTGIKALMTTPAYDGGVTLAAVQVGNTVVTTLYSSSGKDKGAAAVPMAKKIAAKVNAAAG